MKKINTLKLIGVLLISISFSHNLLAVDGVIELNQTCATQLGCVVGDTPGFPITIDATSGSSSYRLTSDLIIPDENTNGIHIITSNIEIDLNGFQIIREGCIDSLDYCRTTNVNATGTGIYSFAGAFTPALGVVIKNGTIQGMPLGIYFTWGRNRVENMIIYGSSGTAIFANENTTVNNSNLFGNNQGVFGQSGTVITNSKIEDNITNGISINGTGALINNNLIRNNGGIGLKFIATVAGQNSTHNAYLNNMIIDNGTSVSSGTDTGNNFCDTDTVCP